MIPSGSSKTSFTKAIRANFASCPFRARRVIFPSSIPTVHFAPFRSRGFLAWSLYFHRIMANYSLLISYCSQETYDQPVIRGASPGNRVPASLPPDQGLVHLAAFERLARRAVASRRRANLWFVAISCGEGDARSSYRSVATAFIQAVTSFRQKMTPAALPWRQNSASLRAV